MNAAVAAGTIRVEGDRLVADLGPTLRYSDTIRDRLLGEAEEKYAARIFPQVYYHKVHSHEKECYREPVAPEGYEIASPELPFPKDWLMRITDGSKEWWGPFDEIAFCGYSTSGYNVVIRPIAKPFKIDGAGWYKTNKGWEHLDMNALRWFKHSDALGPFHGDTRLISKATPAQAATLDAL